MRKSIATVCLSGTLTEKLDAVTAAGFDGVEIFENDLLTSPLPPESVRARLTDLGLKLELYQPFRDFEGVSTDRFKANLRRARHKFALMRRLGATQLLVCSNVGGDPVADDELAAAQLADMAELAAERGMRVAYEALAWGRHVNDYEHAWRIVEMADHPALGVCLDSFHILSRGGDPAAIERIPGEKIFFLQLSDAPVMSLDVLNWSRHFRNFPGQGGLDVAGLTAHAIRAGYEGPLSLEVFNDVFRQSPADRTAVDAFRSLVALEEATARLVSTETHATAARGEHWEHGEHGEHGPVLVAPPAPVVPSGFAFVELSTTSADELDGLLSALGFTRLGQHRTKPVALWEQGAARILINAGHGAGHGADHRFGLTRLSTLGLESANPETSVARAAALGSPVLPRSKAADEVELNSISAPDGTEIFFCRTGEPDHSSWTADFEPTGHAARPPAISRVDHVALTQPWRYFDEATLFYRSVLGLEPYDSLDVLDPHGLLRSRAVSSADGLVRLALNVPPASASGTDAPTQHVAFRTDDILTTAHRLHEGGAEPLRVSPNYYDDLEARYELDAGFANQLREFGLLYDRSGDAEFLQLFTLTQGEVFFEVVQRIGGYDGYGAANAPYRLAAQHAAAARSRAGES
ncbi:MAG: bifunctional sugar phosphate isomerase/epimerase/4-hydroxyphenylpyruvate dioxygenase family protein [Streptosporangiaceae bacterium]